MSRPPLFHNIKNDALKLFSTITEFGDVIASKRWVYPSFRYLHLRYKAWKNGTSYFHEALVWLASRHTTRLINQPSTFKGKFIEDLSFINEQEKTAKKIKEYLNIDNNIS